MSKYEYKSKQIEFEESANPKLSIDGKSAYVSYDVEAKNYLAAELPYHTFGSPKEVAEAIVDHRSQD